MRNKFSTYLFLVFSIVLLLENSCKKDDETPKVVKTHFNPELTYDTVSDFDKNIYKTIAIGQQIWLAENLKTTHYSDGTPIPYCASNSDWSGLTTGGYCWNENEIKNKAIYGGIYNFYAVVDRRNVCPSGWHVPNYNDWYILQQGLGGDEFVGGHLKEIEFDHWEKPNTGADNSSGFTALPASGRSANGDFGVSGYSTGLWTSTEVNLTNAWWSDLGYNKSYLGANPGLKTQGLSIRCIKDQYHISITSITNILHKSAMIYGFVYSDYPAALLESGICWSTEPEPTVNDNLIMNLSGIGYFSCFLKNLTPGAKYFVKAYAIFSKDTIYGDETYFETPVNPLSAITTIANKIFANSAECIVYISNDGGLAINARGVCWSTSASPTVDLPTKTNNGIGKGEFTSSIIGLTENTEYFFRAYATNSQGTAYGNEIKVKTPIAALPTVTTANATNIKAMSATSGGNVIFNGNLPVIARGVCWSTSANPTVDLPSKTINGTGTGLFTGDITGLIDNTLYYIRAYATNSLGTAYGEEKSFTTLKSTIPTLMWNTISNVSFTSANCESQVYSDGNSTVTERGFCWSTTSNLTIENSNKIVCGAGLGYFTFNLTGLTEGVEYYVRPYAINSKGVAYGFESNFITLKHSIPILNTYISNIGLSSADCDVNIYRDGYYPITERGIYWSTSPNPTIESANKIISGSNSSYFTCNIAGLSEGTKYYVKSYAINSMGIGYGAEVNFTTAKHTIPVVGFNWIDNIRLNSADCNVNISSDGFYPITERGICWSTSPNPSVESGNKIVSLSTSSYFKCSITGLSEDTKYFLRGYAINSMGIGYGQEVSFSTLKKTTPIFSGIRLQNISYSTAEFVILLSSDGNSSITESGICWSTIPNPTIENSNKIIGETRFDWVKHKISGLEPNTTYYAKGYAINGKGVGYSEEISFKVLALTVPKLTTFNASYVTSTSLTIGGSITDDGGSSIIDRGICWSTSPNPTIELNDKMSLGVGIGTFNGNVTGLTENTKYYFRSYATNSFGISYGNEVAVLIYFGNVTDIDGNVYNTLAIGEQIWMMENLKTTKYSNGDPIPNFVSNDEWKVQTIGAYCWNNNNINNKNTYGALYNAYTVMDSRKLCPVGWHVPSHLEWNILSAYLGGEDVAGGKMKAITLWENPNIGADNSSGFSAFAGGERDVSGGFSQFGRVATFWASSGTLPDYLYERGIYSYSTILQEHVSGSSRTKGYSIRCLKD